MSHTSVRAMTPCFSGKLCPLVCVLLLGLKRREKSWLVISLLHLQETLHLLQWIVLEHTFLGEEMGFNQKIFKMQLKELIMTPCPIDEMQQQVWPLLSSFQQEQIFHARSYSQFLQLGSLVI